MENTDIDTATAILDDLEERIQRLANAEYDPQPAPHPLPDLSSLYTRESEVIDHFNNALQKGTKHQDVRDTLVNHNPASATEALMFGGGALFRHRAMKTADTNASAARVELSQIRSSYLEWHERYSTIIRRLEVEQQAAATTDAARSELQDVREATADVREQLGYLRSADGSVFRRTIDSLVLVGIWAESISGGADQMLSDLAAEGNTSASVATDFELDRIRKLISSLPIVASGAVQFPDNSDETVIENEVARLLPSILQAQAAISAEKAPRTAKKMQEGIDATLCWLAGARDWYVRRLSLLESGAGGTSADAGAASYDADSISRLSREIGTNLLDELPESISTIQSSIADDELGRGLPELVETASSWVAPDYPRMCFPMGRVSAPGFGPVPVNGRIAPDTNLMMFAETAEQTALSLTSTIATAVANMPVGGCRVVLGARSLTGPLLDALGPLEESGQLTAVAPNEMDGMIGELDREVHDRNIVVRGQPIDDTWLRDPSTVVTMPLTILVISNPQDALSRQSLGSLREIMVEGPRVGICVFMVSDPPQTEEELAEAIEMTGIAKGAPFVVVRPYEACWLLDGGLDEGWRFEPHTATPAQLRDLMASIAVSGAQRLQVPNALDALDLQPPASTLSLIRPSDFAGPLGFSASLGGAAWTHFGALDEGIKGMIVAGGSGQGKSRSLIALLGQLAYRYGPDELELVLVDLKGGATFSYFISPQPWLPHLKLYVDAYDPDWFLSLARWLRNEMQERQTLLKETNEETGMPFENISNWRAAGRAMSRMLVVVDELGEYCAANSEQSKEVMSVLASLARQGRSAGINLIISSQNFDSVAGAHVLQDWQTLKGNYMGRVSFKAEPKTAREILGTGSEEMVASLRARGMIFSSEGGPQPVAIEALELEDSQLPAFRDRISAKWSDTKADPRVLMDRELLTVSDEARQIVGTASAPSALMGQPVDIAPPLAVDMQRHAGRSLAIVGSGTEAAIGALQWASASLAATDPESEWIIVRLSNDDEIVKSASTLVQALEASGRRAREISDPGLAAETLAALSNQREATDRPVTVVAFDADRAPLGDDQKAEILVPLASLWATGAVLGIRVIGWLASPDPRGLPRRLDWSNIGVVGALALSDSDMRLVTGSGYLNTPTNGADRMIIRDIARGQQLCKVVPYAPSDTNSLTTLITKEIT